MLIADFSNHLNFIGSINAKTYQALEAKTWGGRGYEQTEKEKRAEAWGVTVWRWIILVSVFVLNFYVKIF